MKIGVVGAGTMGALAVELLVNSGEKVIVTDVFPAALERAAAAGASTAPTPQALAAQAEIILLLLPGPAQIEAVVTNADGLLAAAREGQVIVDMCTSDPHTTRRMGEAAAGRGVDYLDAPILGRPSAVGRWVLPVGGEAAVLARALPVLEKLGSTVTRVGPLGAGHTLKLLNALMFSAINAMTAEMMAIARKTGLDPRVMFETISGSEAATVSGLFKEVGRKIVAREFAPAFTIDLLCKDNGLAIAMAEDFGAPPILANAIQVINKLARARGLGSEDTSALVKVYEDLLLIGDRG